MDKSALFGGALLLCAAAGLGVYMIYEKGRGGDADPARQELAATLSDLAERVEHLSDTVKTLEAAAADRNQAATDRIDALEARLTGIEGRSLASVSHGDGGPAVEEAGEAAADSETTPQEFQGLLEKVFGRTGERATAEEEQRFWQLARTTGMLDHLIAAHKIGINRSAAFINIDTAL